MSHNIKYKTHEYAILSKSEIQKRGEKGKFIYL